MDEDGGPETGFPFGMALLVFKSVALASMHMVVCHAAKKAGTPHP